MTKDQGQQARHRPARSGLARLALGSGRAGVWRWATPFALGVCGVLVVTSAASSDGTDLRPGRYADLGSVVRAENQDVRDLQGRAADLADEVDTLGRGQSDGTTRRYRREAAAAAGVAGMEPRRGEGLTITLSDAPEEVMEASEEDPNRLVVHQQDIQAVVNALWRGGAEAVTLQGRRIISTTGIKCSGSSVLLQGVAYPQPYEIGAVGDVSGLLESLGDDDYVSLFRSDAARPDIDVGFDVDESSEVAAPAYEGPVSLSYAEPAR